MFYHNQESILDILVISIQSQQFVKLDNRDNLVTFFDIFAAVSR